MYGEPLRKQTAAIAPVVGILLLLSITVLLAATVGVFVMEMDAADRDLVQAVDLEISLGDSNDTVLIDHDGGTDLPVENTVVVIENATPAAANGEYELASLDGSLSADENLTAASTVRIDGSDVSGTPDFSGATVKVIQQGNHGRTVVVSTWTGPKG
ncbi:type IV pilin [Halorhabdus salina]|uniref:type IV pilin n=1 Tax=Halorhabdus salina TaxID=2750670 RepID=UPI0015EE6189|nr:type IV pilin [Halorhabdus salina]